MSWASIANNQTVSYNNLQDAVNNGVFILKNAIPVNSKQLNKSEAEYYVYINPISKATNQLVVKSNLISNPPTTTTTTTLSLITLSVTPGCAGGEGTGTVLANAFGGGTGSFEYITISDISSGDALTKLDNPATRTFIGGATEYTFTGLGNATYYVAIMDYSGNKGVSTGAVVNCITTTTTTTTTCNPTPQWTVVFGVYDCYGTCNKYYVEKDLNPCSPTYNQERQGPLAESNSTFCYIPGTNCCGQSTTANWVNNGAAFCSGCIAYQPEIDNNPCSATYNNTRNTNLGTIAPCNYSANYSSAVGTLYVCNVVGGGVNSYTVYENTNGCFTGNQYFANGNSYATNPSNSYPDTTQNWQPTGAPEYCGEDLCLYQPQVQINPCAVNYLGTRDEQIGDCPNALCASQYPLDRCDGFGTSYTFNVATGTFYVGQIVIDGFGNYFTVANPGVPGPGGIAVTATAEIACPQLYTTFINDCTSGTFYIASTGYSGKGVVSSYPGECFTTTGTTTSPSGTEIFDWTPDALCTCV